MRKVTFFVSVVLLFATFEAVQGYMVDNNPYHRVETLDPSGKYRLEWLVNHGAKHITFNVTVETRGYVGFGLSAKGRMSGADMIIGGVRKNGRTYFSDRYGKSNQVPDVDRSQDWILNSARETDTHTFLSFSRPFDTCDPQDYAITEDTIALIWAYGERDVVEYHHQNKGVFNVFLLHPDYSPQIQNASDGSFYVEGKEFSDLKVWTINHRQVLPARDTTYWCTLFPAPKLAKKHHIIGFQTKFPDEISRRHYHHIVVLKCTAPSGRSPAAFFDPLTRLPGQPCTSSIPTGQIPVHMCTEMFSSWGVGGRGIFHPPEVGVPFGSEPVEYYMVQFHLDNPNQLRNLVVSVQLDYFYTDKLRANDGGIIFATHTVPGLPESFLIPPSSPDHVIQTHCGSGCTRQMFPPEGITMYASQFHTHYTGVKAKFQHFRQNRELPWIANDNYNNRFQQTTVLNQYVKIMPGDFFTTRCHFDNTGTNGTTVGGLSTSQEMCVTVMYYYTKIPRHSHCHSQIDSEPSRDKFLGVSNITWNESELEYIVNSPSHLAGLKISQVSDEHVNWNLERRQEFQELHLSHPHRVSCDRSLLGDDPSVGGFRISETAQFPFNAEPYQPPQRSCPLRKHYQG